ncbi:MAG: hypothetical protein PHN19_03480 [Patescibacteria group bacterium]|nr:hypothetical protein [Patescibacteria group bacterium]
MQVDDQMDMTRFANRREALLKCAEITDLSEDAISLLHARQIRTIADLVKVANKDYFWERMLRADIAIFDRFLRNHALHRWMSEQEVDALLT